MFQFLDLMESIFGHLYDLLADSRIANVLGVNLFWALFGFFVMWTVLNMCVFRGSISPGALISVMPRSQSPEAEVKVTQQYFVRHTRDDNGGFKTVKTHRQIVRTPDGDTYTESWDE